MVVTLKDRLEMDSVHTDELDTQQALTAMVTLIMSARESTAGYAAAIEMIDKDGNTVTGAESARSILMGSLMADQDAWAEWLRDVKNLNAATSMRVALSGDMKAELGANSPILAALEAIRRPMPADTRRIIDLREQATSVIDVTDGSNVAAS
jgi:hypothetical protein